jgi:PAS domain-containing protein
LLSNNVIWSVNLELSSIHIAVILLAVVLLAALSIYYLHRYKTIKEKFNKLEIEADRHRKKNNKLTDLIEDLSSSTKFFINIFDDHPAMMFLANAENFSILDVNKSAIHFYGYSKSDFLQKTLFDLNVLQKKRY